MDINSYETSLTSTNTSSYQDTNNNPTHPAADSQSDRK